MSCTDARTHNIASPWAPVRAEKKDRINLCQAFWIRREYSEGLLHMRMYHHHLFFHSIFNQFTLCLTMLTHKDCLFYNFFKPHFSTSLTLATLIRSSNLFVTTINKLKKRGFFRINNKLSWMYQRKFF